MVNIPTICQIYFDYTVYIPTLFLAYTSEYTRLFSNILVINLKFRHTFLAYTSEYTWLFSNILRIYLKFWYTFFSIYLRIYLIVFEYTWHIPKFYLHFFSHIPPNIPEYTYYIPKIVKEFCQEKLPINEP